MLITYALGAIILLSAGVVLRIALDLAGETDVPEAHVALSVVAIVLLVAALAAQLSMGVSQ